MSSGPEWKHVRRRTYDAETGELLQDAEILKGETGEPEGDDPDVTMAWPPQGIPVDQVLGQVDKREGEEPNAGVDPLIP